MQQPRSPWAAYSLAVLAIAVAMGVRILLQPLLGNHYPSATLFLAILVIAWYEGFGPALLVTVGGCLLTVLSLQPPRGNLDMERKENQIGLAIYLLIGLGFSVLGGSMRVARRKAVERSQELARRQAELEEAHRRLYRQREELKVTLTSIGDAVITTDLQGRVTFLNVVAQQLTGWTVTEATGVPLTEVFRIINETTRQPVENPALRALRESVIVGLANHTILIARDGTERAIDDSAAPILDEQGQLIGCVLVFRDITERRRLERENTERQTAARFLAALVESSGDAILSMSLQGMIQTWNASAERLFGHTAAETVGQHISLVIPEERRGEEELLLARISKGERIEHFDTVRVRRDGQPVEVSLTISPIRDASGQVVGASKIVRDITERRLHEARLKAERDRVQMIADAVPALISYIDAEARYRLTNRAYETWFGHPREQTIGRHMREVLGETAWKSIQPHVNKVLAGQVIHYEAEVQYQEGGTRWINATYTPDVDVNGVVQGFVAHVNDVTERRKAEDALRVSEQQFQSFMSNSPATAFIKDAAGRFLFVNRQLELLFDRPLAEWIGKTDFDFFPEPDARQFRQNDESVLSTRRMTQFLETSHLADGMRCYLSFKFPLQDREGNWLLGGMAVDMTEQKRAEQALRDADQRKDEFLATLAHELRNPLAPIRTGLEVIRMAGEDRELLEQARSTMSRQVELMVRLIDDLLDISRITQNKLILRREPVELKLVVEHAVETAQPQIDQGRHQLTVAFPPEPVTLDADPSRLAQVFANLLTNAAKYTEEGGQIWLEARQEESEVVVAVRDTGIGISEEHLPRLFEMFSQVAPALERAQGGLGIGLALVSSLVEMHGGQIEARSEGLGRGSEFLVRLPVLTEPVVRTAPLPEPDGADRTSRLRVLVVDDKPDVAKMLALALRLQGNEVHLAHDGQAAVDRAAELQPDAIFLDIGLPVLNGYEACRRIRQLSGGNTILMVALTGWGQAEDKQKALDAGFDHHRTKPIDANELPGLLAQVPRTE